METFEKYLTENFKFRVPSRQDDMGSFGRDTIEEKNIFRLIKYKEKKIECCMVCMDLDITGGDHCDNTKNKNIARKVKGDDIIPVSDNGWCPNFKE